MAHRKLLAAELAADAPWKLVERTEFLLKLQPRLRYDLIGHNCEHAAKHVRQRRRDQGSDVGLRINRLLDLDGGSALVVRPA